MFEVEYNDQMEAEITRLEAKNRALSAGHPEWDNACSQCGCQLTGVTGKTCDRCS